ncbi:MAG: oligosaccharide flippase family protein, partial [Bacteroidia bacterium]|nr:oligosaccharide flippase family protein [Bacteroidia bacterium]
MLRIIGNKIILFIVSRYLSYFIQFLNSLIIAYVLGPFYLGIWGFLALILQYMNFGNFGIDIALNVNLSTGDIKDVQKQSNLASNAVFATFISCTLYLLIGVVLYLFDFALFEKYMFTRFMLVVILISCMNYFNVLFLNIFRTYSLFTPISIFQTILQALQLPMFLFFKDVELIWALLVMMIAAHFISMIIFIRKMPLTLHWKIDYSLVKSLYKRGASLLSYALTFYILLLSTRSMVGYFYPVETMGYFTFSANIASALIVGLSSLEFVLFPKMLNRLSSDSISEKTLTTFEEIRYIYMSTAFLATAIGLLSYPVLLLFFKEYEGTESVFTYLVICQVIISSGFGYSTLIISKGREQFLVVHGLVALFINLALSYVAHKIFNCGYSIMALLLIV